LRIFIPGELPKVWCLGKAAKYFLEIISDNELVITELKKMFPLAQNELTENSASYIVKQFNSGVTNPKVSSLHSLFVDLNANTILREVIISDKKVIDADFVKFKSLWCEPAVEKVSIVDFSFFQDNKININKNLQRSDPSFKLSESPNSDFDLDFSAEELNALLSFAKKNDRQWNKTEWEVFAQSWSEHCKHKIFAAKIECQNLSGKIIDSLFKTFIKAPTDNILNKNPNRALSVFVDNAGVLPLTDYNLNDTDYGFCLKMETHNSPSAIAPYGGASTGIVGVHRDILGTGLGAMPIANWNVLCFESDNHNQPRPEKALEPEVVRKGVIRGIEEGGNQSGIPTVQGSIVFEPNYAVKPLVYAGAVGLIPKKFVEKKSKVGLDVFSVGGAVGIDGLKGAVMSSRDLRSTDFSGSAVQVAQPFIQRKVTDFLLVARDQGLIQELTDNGAGGLSCSLGEMARSTNGINVDLTNLSLKYKHILPWERLLSESQERMTIATSKKEEFIQLAKRFSVTADYLGKLNDSGDYKVTIDVADKKKTLINIPMDLLFDGCPTLELVSNWDLKAEINSLKNKDLANFAEPILSDLLIMLQSEHLCSRKAVSQKFDHEVQGRSLTQSFCGVVQNSPRDNSILEIYEVADSAICLAHGLSPWRNYIVENMIHSFDECIRSAVLCGINFNSSGLLDNYSWPDPIVSKANPHGAQRLWQLVRANEVLAECAKVFDIPFVSGKDSMKNNSNDFAVPPTCVVSVGASVVNPWNVPVSFFSRSNDVVFYLPIIKSTLRNSAWQRVLKKSSRVNNNFMFTNESIASQQEEIVQVLHVLKSRYLKINDLIINGKIRSAKDVGEGGLITCLFEMCAGREMGLLFSDNDLDKDVNKLFAEGLGGMVFACDPHMAEEVQETLPELLRLGSVIKDFKLYFNQKNCILLDKHLKAYNDKGQQGFFG